MSTAVAERAPDDGGWREGGGMADVEAVIRRTGGIARTTPGRHAAAARGVLLRMRRGTYALSDTPEPVRHALAHGGALCCASAAAAHGLWTFEADRTVHVWLGPDARAHPGDGGGWHAHREEGSRPRGIVPVRVRRTGPAGSRRRPARRSSRRR